MKLYYLTAYSSKLNYWRRFLVTHDDDTGAQLAVEQFLEGETFTIKNTRYVCEAGEHVFAEL